MPKLTPPTTPKSAIAYDEYVRQAVRAALDDPRPNIPHEQAKRDFALKRATLLQRSMLDK
ncbi:hypothetical protein [Chromobacterium vaccinii]|uniref:antitoxin PaaA2 family protein n=1 Tax=Chromobacterium vaccinii TaxID=1108595 RepID=UPI000617F327|nr:hypothetical protein [Chromobacterium vaccinii]